MEPNRTQLNLTVKNSQIGTFSGILRKVLKRAIFWMAKFKWQIEERRIFDCKVIKIGFLNSKKYLTFVG
jgi:small-conductance mechanosensitive channel